MSIFAKCSLLTIPFLLLTACDTREIDPDTLETVEQEQKIKPSCEPIEFEGVNFTHCSADPEHHSIRTVHLNAEGEPYGSLSTYQASRSTNAPPVAFALNAGAIDEESNPIGYYVEKGVRSYDLNLKEDQEEFGIAPNGVFFGFAGAEWLVWECERFYENVRRRPDFGTQSGPMLVWAAEINPAFAGEPGEAIIRSAVGRDEAGRAHFVISDEPVTLGQMARLFRDVYGTPNAMQLSGENSQLWAPASNRLDIGPTLGPMIVVEMNEIPQ